MHINIVEGSLAVITSTVEGDEFGFDPGDLVVVDHYDIVADNWVVKSAFDDSLTCNVSFNNIVALNVKDVVRYLKNIKEVKK